MQSTFTTNLQHFEDSNLWGYYLPVPLDIALGYKSAKISRLICNIPSLNHQMPCAIMPRGEDRYFIMFNKDTVKKLKLRVGQQLELTLHEDTSEFGMPLCEEMEILLAEDKDFDYYFRKLTPGKQRNVIYYVGKPKSSDLRIRTALVFANHLKERMGNLDFKILHQEMKNK
ncbi:MAG TPA: hypothetical protein PKD85_10265 [Saprospiraceae bacterium]|nr:hypothetical protein [Saprospiraceae bacterium]